MLKVVLSHPWHKNKNVPGMGHPEFLGEGQAWWIPCLKSETWGTRGFEIEKREDVPRGLKPNDFWGIDVRAEARTIHRSSEGRAFPALAEKQKPAKDGAPKDRGMRSSRLVMFRVVLSHPWHKNNGVPWMGHPASEAD
jgi:hypothetical protein